MVRELKEEVMSTKGTKWYRTGRAVEFHGELCTVRYIGSETVTIVKGGVLRTVRRREANFVGGIAA